MTLGADPTLARGVVSSLDALRATVLAAEDDVLACLVVTGEPRPQRVLDDWLDQVADTLRALGENAEALAPAVSRRAGTRLEGRDAAVARDDGPSDSSAHLREQCGGQHHATATDVEAEV